VLPEMQQEVVNKMDDVYGHAPSSTQELR
jgi:hypothetical protein